MKLKILRRKSNQSKPRKEVSRKVKRLELIKMIDDVESLANLIVQIVKKYETKEKIMEVLGTEVSEEELQRIRAAAHEKT